MSESLTPVYEAVEKATAPESVKSRRAIIAGVAGLAGGIGLLGSFPGLAEAHDSHRSCTNGDDPQTILNIAATAEVLATIVNTVGSEKGLFGADKVTQRNVAAAAREELIHYNVLTSVGAVPLTKSIWVPNAVFANASGLIDRY